MAKEFYDPVTGELRFIKETGYNCPFSFVARDDNGEDLYCILFSEGSGIDERGLCSEIIRFDLTEMEQQCPLKDL